MSKNTFWLLILFTVAFVGSAESQQPRKVAKLGYLSSVFTRFSPQTQAFLDELRKLGNLEGQNLLLEFRTAEGKVDRIPDLAAQIARADVDVIVAPGPEAILRAVTQVTKSIPVVMIAIDYDPIEWGYIAGLARPGGHITGLFSRQLELTGKRVELLKESFPQTSRLAIFWDVFSVDQVKDAEMAAKASGNRTLPLQLDNPSYDVENAFKAARQGNANALLVLMSPVFLREAPRIAQEAVKNRCLQCLAFESFRRQEGSCLMDQTSRPSDAPRFT